MVRDVDGEYSAVRLLAATMLILSLDLMGRSCPFMSANTTAEGSIKNGKKITGDFRRKTLN